MDGSVH